jgi:hypothetical protein
MELTSVLLAVAPDADPADGGVTQAMLERAAGE